MKIEGKWIGQYTYGNDYPTACIGTSISFEINVTSNGINFYGNFSDDETRDIFQDSGVIGGFLEGDYISFDKQYPKAWQLSEAGTVEIIEGSIPPIIRYEGVFSNNQFKGSWEILHYYKGDEGPFSMVLGTGTWNMKKDMNQ